MCDKRSNVTLEGRMFVSYFLVRCLEMPEWADDSLDGDIDSGTATFEEDGTYIRSTSVQQSNTDQRKEMASSSSMSDLSLSQTNAVSVLERVAVPWISSHHEFSCV